MLVSVVIPTYNRPDFLKEAIESVLAQTFKDFEVIVIDDKEQKGPSAARNSGVKQAKGDYIAFLDSDDLWDKQKLAKQVAYLQNNRQFKACYTNEKWLYNGRHLNQMKKHQKYHGSIFAQCLPLCIISASSILIEKKLFNDLGCFDESLPACEDYDLWLRLTAKQPIAFLDEQLIIKRGGHADQLSKKYWGMDRFRIKALEKLLKSDLTLPQREQTLTELNKKYHVLVVGSWKRKKLLRWAYYKFKQGWKNLKHPT